MHLTGNWLVYANGAVFNATRLSDIVWVYKHTLNQRYLGLPAYTSYSVIVYDRHEGRVTLPSTRREKEADDLVYTIHQRAPWAVKGFTYELKNLWRTQPDKCIQQVEGRKQLIMEQSNPDQPD